LLGFVDDGGTRRPAKADCQTPLADPLQDSGVSNIPADSAERADPLLSIGVFSRRSWLSMKALRLYDRLGLLPPADVDPNTGYRRYRESQLFTARLIEMLRRLDMPLSQIAEILTAPGPEGAELLSGYWGEIERRIAAQRYFVRRLEDSLRGGEERFGGFQVEVRTVPAQYVLTELHRPRWTHLEPWLTGAKQRVRKAAAEYGGPAGDLFVIFHGPVTEESDGPVEVCLPVDPGHEPAGGVEGTTARWEPEHREAYVRITKAQFELPQILSGYDAVERWIASHGLTWLGSPREVYPVDVDPDTAALTDVVCDVAYPIPTPPRAE
jgi:DNA-binding transcriptional MerR regulator